LPTNKHFLALLLKLSRVFPQSLRSRLGNLKSKMAKANIIMSFEAYLGLMAFISLVGTLVTFFVSLIVLSFFLEFVPSLIFSFLLGLLVYATSAGVTYWYPAIGISSRKQKIEANLPLIANFMSVLSASGMPPERVIRSLANVGDEFSIGDEARRIVADIELNGLDLNNALKNASLRSPSKDFSTMLSGMVTTSHMGGDIAGYLRLEAEKYKKTRMQSLKGFIESIGLIAEIYVTFLIALPLALVIMLSVMSFIGEGALIVGLNPQVILMMLTFVVTPACVGILLLLVDSLTPVR
jgi:flagellar protein FlaJ